MKRVAAFILSLTLLWFQVMASAQTLSAPTATQCGCCTGNKACCCVEDAAPDAAPIPVAPAPNGSSIDFSAVLTKLVVWSLPETEPAIAPAKSPSSLASLAVPLFQWNCALLI